MPRKRRKNQINAGELNLTAMIDIAFQMLSFFIITIKPVDVMAHLDVLRPSTDKSASKNQVPNVIRVIILPNAEFAINERPVDRAGLEKMLTHLADLDKTQSILLLCNADSQHSDLIAVLDICAKVGLTNLSVVSSN